MNHILSNVKPIGHDNFIRLFKRVMNDSELTPLQKIILSDVISLQVQGKRYYKTSKALAKELGNVKTKTIQDNFQKLNKMGYLDCFPFKASNDETYSLREVIVVDIDKWISDEDTYTKLNLNTKKRELKDKNHPTRMAWPNRQGKNQSSSNIEVDSQPDHIASKTQEEAQIALPIVHFDNLNHSTYIRDAVRRAIKRGEQPNFFVANIDLDGGEFVQDTIVRVNDKNNPKQNHMRKEFIFDDWNQEHLINTDDELLDDLSDELENLD